ncbi:hypothetical protein OHR86_15335 [Streptomyces sp. NBC_00441]|uniref:hypothetical protein n=1 Tax=Streptomyces sp. NBC_00441 TaxID=2975742 RepID=UPI002E2B719B|nr:hypothetical protein [Streptomyces sp. NBC_00441]
MLAHQSDGTACQWKDKADELNKAGYRVLAAAPRLKPQPDAVVALSAPTQYARMNALRAVPELTSPVLYMVAEPDGDFGAGVREMNRKSVKSPEHKLVHVRDESAHGVALLYDDARWATVRGLLANYGS